MQTIINIDDENYKYVTEYAKQHNRTAEEVINELINQHIVEVNEKYRRTNKQEINDFAKVMQRYFHEDLEDMYTVINSEEVIPTDKPMINVYKKLFQDISLRNAIVLELFEEYKKRG